ncbi:hypothetical protein TYRP_017111 [Tyrophagus putrescentiae]|nr:hypothetical protein TYRP_017111 [Tyrophagus putrescentiae]
MTPAFNIWSLLGCKKMEKAVVVHPHHTIISRHIENGKASVFKSKDDFLLLRLKAQSTQSPNERLCSHQLIISFSSTSNLPKQQPTD